MALRTLYQTLLDSELARLQVIARLWNIPLTAERRADMAAELADAMSNAAAVQRVTAQLAPDQRAALDDLLRHAGALPWPTFARQWGQIRSIGPARLEREELWRAPISPAEGLWFYGLLQRAYAGAVEMAFIPEELQLYLPVPAPLAAPPPPASAPPPALHEAGEQAAEDLTRLLAYLQTQPVRRNANGTWPARRREQLRRQLSPSTEPYLALLETLALEQGWLEAQPDYLRPAAAPWLTWLESTRWEQWLVLARAWEHSAAWNDLAHVPTLELAGEAGWPNQPRATRARFMEQLRCCTPTVWYGISEFIAYLHAQSPDFLRPDGDYDTWPLHDRRTATRLRGFNAWPAVEGGLVDFYLRGPLAWLGLVDVGFPAPELPADRFRLSAAGAAWLELAPPPTLPDPAPLDIRPEGLVSVPTGRRYERFQLSRVAQPIPGDPTRYRLTPRAVQIGKQQHISLPRIVEFLETASDKPLPDALRGALTRAYQTPGEAAVEQLWVLRVKNPAMLDLPGLRPYIRERLSPQLALIRHSDRERVIALLAQHGLLPDVQESVYN